MGLFTEEKNEIFSIFKRIKNRDFSGNSGQAVKNSFFQICFAFVSKIGALLFTIILARLLMPEFFGLYTVALGTILVFSYFSDLGIGQTLIRFVSKESSKNNLPKAKAYGSYLFKIKFIVLSGIMIIFIILIKPLTLYYQKPLFLIFFSGILYLFAISISNFFQSFFNSLNDFKTPFIRETLFQIIRLIIIPLTVIYLLNKSFSGEQILIIIFIILGTLWSFLAFFLFFLLKKTSLIKSEKILLEPNEKKGVNLFFSSLLIFSIFSTIFNYLDIFILGGFVSSEYIGYYQSAMGLIGSLVTLVLYSNSLLPIFSRLSNEDLDKGFKRVFKLTFLISLFFSTISFLFSDLIINLLYGESYAPASFFLKGLSLLLILLPFNSLYNGYFIAKGKPNIIKNLLIFVSIFNLVFTFSLVYFLSKQSEFLAVFGVIIGLLVSNTLYLLGCVLKKRESSK